MRLSNSDLPFDIASLPLLDLMGGPVTVDIGYLSGAAHRRVFAEVLGKVLNDNAGLLGRSQLTRVDAARPIREEPSLPLAAQDLVARSARLAFALYDSGNESVRLEFTTPGMSLRIGVRFDNPEFWLE